MHSTIDGSGAVFEQLRPRLKAISRRIVGSAAEAEDIVQDCFLKWHASNQGEVATPVAWLTTVVQHHSIDRVRQRAREASAACIAAELLPAAPVAAPEATLLRRAELGQALAQLLAYLSAAERLALVLHEVFECGHADIAAALGTSVLNARQHLARARRRLRAAQDKTMPDEKQCRELLRRFQAAINGVDLPAMVSLLADEQPVSVQAFRQGLSATASCANDPCYLVALAA